MGAEIQKKISAEVEYIAGSGGIFEIVADGREIFSKRKIGRFPDASEIIKILK
ncbi:MAG: Rdx family protein [Proteobacteria bacterium]|nr:Rdx family protein [Pseudomonadota bacterium]MBU1709216.1 Rdx family protein [Pseudomonadota bacterium]